jgi:hypothetical protein
LGRPSNALSGNSTVRPDDWLRSLISSQCSVRRELTAEWADVAVCVHPHDKAAREQPEQVAGASNVVTAFHAISSAERLREWDSGEVLAATVDSGASVTWSDWMKQRYVL